ncbi:MAG: hypothetical protein NTW87_07745 [Planctomycetota bacterium]|nr:hypothetical protein [Planctomycetota bacterium]
MKRAPERIVLDDPDQLFFEFAAPAAPPQDPAPSAAATAPSQPETDHEPGAAVSQRGVSTNVAALRASTDAALCHEEAVPDAATPFMTEARAAGIFMQVARERQDGEVKRAHVVFKPFRATLYSFRIRRGGTASVKFHVAFRRASERVVTQAAQLMLTRRRKARRVLRRADYDAFVRGIPHTDFELPGARRGRLVSILGPGRYQ